MAHLKQCLSHWPANGSPDDRKQNHGVNKHARLWIALSKKMEGKFMHRIRQTISLVLLMALVSAGLTAQAQRRRTRVNNAQLDQVIRNVENSAERFRSSLDTSLNNSRVGNSRRADNVNTYERDFEQALAQLRDRFNRRMARAADVQLVLDRATLINNFMNRGRLDATVQNDWTNLRVSLNDLARAYGINWQAGNVANTYPAPYPVDNPPYGNPTYNQPYGTDANLTGTFRLDRTQSNDARTAAEQAARSVPYRDRQRVIDQVMTRLDAPDALAIERRGRTVTIASTRAPQITFEADGVQRTEQLPSGRSVRATAMLNGDQLTVSTSGDRNSDFSVTFEPTNNGRTLYVTRRISDISLSQPVTVRSVYTRTSDVAQFDVYNGSVNGYPTTGNVGTSSDVFVIPNNTTLIAVLNNDLSTQNTREGERFTMTVRDPAQYDGATIEGTVSHLQRSGRISGRSEMTLNFDTIRLRDGSSYRFAGIIDNVRSVNGESVRVDNEGTVQDTDSRGTTTAQRAAIGTAVGAIIGAIAGGGKGAAIGAILGAGGGAGSVYVQGADDLVLRSGTEIAIRATGPNR
jgi:hypothetical protein